jgi:hypothetical protein
MRSDHPWRGQGFCAGLAHSSLSVESWGASAQLHSLTCQLSIMTVSPQSLVKNVTFFFFSFLTVTPEGDGTARFCYHCHLASFVVHLFIVGFISKLKTERRHTYKVSELDFGPVRVEFGPLVGRLR